MIPAGSSRSFAARSTSIPSGPVSAVSHWRWSRPIAWWCVIVPPFARTASEAAVLAARHWASASSSWRARKVK